MSCKHNQNVIFGDGSFTNSFNTTTWCQDCGAFRTHHNGPWLVPGEELVKDEAPEPVVETYNETKAKKAHANIANVEEEETKAIDVLEEEHEEIKEKVEDLFGGKKKGRGRPRKA